MKKTHTIARMQLDGKLMKRKPNGTEEALSERPVAPSEADIEATAASDRDNPPITPERESRLQPVPRVKTLRRALGLHRKNFRLAITFPLERFGTGSKGGHSQINRHGLSFPLLPGHRRKWRNCCSSEVMAM